ncbi:MAG: hypothetical protein PUB32_06340 [Clostridiales bacterium]|nr:hypothetical protein [Clostridiales bacterium]
MAEKIVPGPVNSSAGIREAVCIHTRKIYDSCRDKDCIEDLRFYPDCDSRVYINSAVGVRAKSVELLNVRVNVEPVAFNRGYYTIDVRYFYRIKGEAYTLGNNCNEIRGLVIFDKRVLLFGSEGSAKIFTSRPEDACLTLSQLEKTNMPVAVVEAVDPIVLDFKLVETCDCNPCDFDAEELPSFVCEAFPSSLDTSNDTRRIYVTLGQFSIIRLERDSQLLIPAYDYCMPEKECVGSGDDDPCDLFRRIKFPVDEFFPPNSVSCYEDRCGNPIQVEN